MCWGAFCTDQGDGPIGSSLNYDAPSDNVKTARYTKTCATPNNRCNGGNSDANSCDEYPFKVTSDADIEDGVSRCVPVTENNSQGGTLGQFTKNLASGTQFDVIFLNPNSADFCQYPPNCVNKNNLIWQNGGPAPPPKTNPSRKRHYYMTESGKEVLSERELYPGKKFSSVETDAIEPTEKGELGRRAVIDDSHVVEDSIAYHLFTL
ncbi:MAG: hypothetical protein M1827_002205 [Pycnora praestabilis]|nr:MAG: hypothetical protein M1827_002205 [Pycnora praestabilis]